MTTRQPSVRSPGGTSDDRSVERLISGWLRLGVGASLFVVLLGSVVAIVRHPDYVSSASQFARLTTYGSAFPRSVLRVLAGLTRFEGQALIMAGLCMLMATPLMRVVLSLLAFLRQGDRDYVVVTVLLLMILAASSLLGILT